MSALSLREIARRVGGRLVGPDRMVQGVKPLDEAGPDDLSFLAHVRYRHLLQACRAGGVLLTPEIRADHLSVVQVDRPYVALAKVMPLLHPPASMPPGVDPRSDVPKDCELGRGVNIGPFVSLGRGCRIGDRSVLHAGVTLGEKAQIGEDCVLFPGARVLDHCCVGNRVILHAGAVVGSDGFGFAEEGGIHLKIPQIGNVILEDDVELGANVTVDRATFGSTRIRRGTKVDNLVQVGHNCDIGEDCLLVSQVGLSGSVRVGRGTVFAGQSGSVGHLRIGERVRIGAKSAVTEDLADGAFVIGHPARDHREWKRSQAALARLPELRRRVAELERRLEMLLSRPAGKEE
jgi:UDP-3-O-[3-hydroxymyristoyl] glucosamine N-acyltransferase